MARAHKTWKVHPHGPLEKLSERLWRVEGDLPDVEMKRVMTIAKRADGSLVIHNGIALADTAMAEIEAWGTIGTLVVPNGFHRLDARVFLDRYPGVRVVCPPGAKAKVEQVVPVSGSYQDVAADGVVELETLDGTKQREGVMIVRDRDGTHLVINDAIFNMPHIRGFTGFVLRRITGSSGGPRVSNITKWLVIADKPAFRAHLERLAGLPDLRRVIVSHHQVIDHDPAGVLRAVAGAL